MLANFEERRDRVTGSREAKKSILLVPVILYMAPVANTVATFAERAARDICSPMTRRLIN